MKIETSKKAVLVTTGAILIVALFVFLGGNAELNRANKAAAKYDAWANSPEGISTRRLQRDLDRARDKADFDCYLRHAGPDYDVALDCPEIIAPRQEFTPPIPLGFSSAWDYTIFGKALRNDVSDALFEIHMKAVEYWENKP